MIVGILIYSRLPTSGDDETQRRVRTTGRSGRARSNNSSICVELTLTPGVQELPQLYLIDHITSVRMTLNLTVCRPLLFLQVPSESQRQAPERGTETAKTPPLDWRA